MIALGVKVELSEGQMWTLKYGTRAFMALENETGLTLGQAQAKMEMASISTVVAVVWAGLIHAEPKITVDRVAERIDLKLLEGISEAVGEAFEQALGPAEEEDEDNSGNDQTEQTG